MYYFNIYQKYLKVNLIKRWIFLSNNNDSLKKRKPIPQGIKNELLVRSKGICQRCRIPLKGMKPDIHHKNQDPSDNNISNLMVLCRNCHSKMHYNKDGTLKNSTTKISSKQIEKPISKKELLNQLPKTKLKKIVKVFDPGFEDFYLLGRDKEDYIDFLSSSRKVTVKKIEKILEG